MKTNCTLGLLLEEINSELRTANIPERKTESELFLAYLYRCTSAELYLRLNEPVTREKLVLCEEFVKERKRRLPLSYFLGEIEFMGLKFRIQPGVFIPRQETEILVEKTIKIADALSCSGAYRLNILDLGSGSGNIAVSLAKFLPTAKIIATDISEDALRIVQENVQLHNLEKRITLLQGDLFEALATGCSLPAAYDIIVSNPPYIAEKDVADLEKELSYEPGVALFAKDNGLEYYQRIIPQAHRFLKPKGYLLVEIGYGQRKRVEMLFSGGGFEKIEAIKDYSGIERVIVGRGQIKSNAISYQLEKKGRGI